MLGLTQKELGKRCGINEANIRKYESGRQNPKYETLQKIAIALEIPVFFFIFKGFQTTPNENFKNGMPVKTSAEKPQGKLGCDMEELFLNEFSDIIFYYKKLNDHGKSIAVERIAELSKIPDYRKE